VRFSVQQIKYEFLYAIKEFDSDGAQWEVVTSCLPPAETLVHLGHGVDDFIYLGKPTGTARAAEIVKDFFMQRFGVAGTAGPGADGIAEWVIMFRSKQSLPNEANLLEPVMSAKA
jgi:hypothetical protein